PELKVRASAKWALFSDWDRAHQSVHSLEVSLRPPIRPRKLLPLSACRTVVLPEWRAEPNVRVILDMNERPANGSGNADTSAFDLEAATRRLMSALDALEDAVERRRDSDRDENELASRIQALGVDRSRLAQELDNSLVKTRKLERTNREIAERLDAAIGSVRVMLDGGGET